MKSLASLAKHNVRTVVGIVLIVASALGVWLLLRAATASSHVLVANRLLVEGQQIQASDVREESAGSAVSLQEYAQSPELVVGKVVTRVIRAGELIPAASIGEVSQTFETTLVIDIASDLASDLRDGAIVDVWAAPARTGSASISTTSPEPTVVMHRARLAHRITSATATSGTRVEIVLPRDALPAVLAAVSRGDAMTIVAANGGLS